MHAEVTVEMSHPPTAVWDLVSDVTRIGEFSPETFEAEWTDGATGPTVGATFRGHVRRNGVGPTYWAPCRVVSCEPGREFSFTVAGGLTTWGYRLEPIESGTRVTEFFQAGSQWLNRLYWALFGTRRLPTNVAGMRQTLEAMSAALDRAALADPGASEADPVDSDPSAPPPVGQ